MTDMIYVYAGAAVIAGLLIGFLVLSVLWISSKTSDSVNRHAVSLLSEYDSLIRIKSEKLNELEKKLKRARAELECCEQQQSHDTFSAATVSADTADVVKVAERAASAPYREKNIPDAYERISSGFHRDPVGELELLMKNRKEVQARCAADSILSKVSADDFYRLSVLPRKDQRDILSEIFDPEEMKLLENFEKQRGAFDILEFYEEMKHSSVENTKDVKLYVKPGSSVQPEEKNGYRVLTDGDILEGFYICMDGKIYDYSLRRKEIS